jgi:ribonuclease J
MAESLRFIPLGGLGEIGRNMALLEYGDDMVAIDVGLMFPEEEMLGVDLVVPDFDYLLKNREKLRGILITHGHEDHVGALPYLLRQLEAPIYCTRLTGGLISVKLDEHKLPESLVKVIDYYEPVPLGAFEAEFLPVAHSIPDAAAIAVRTPLGVVLHTGDFKLDHTPVMGQRTDLAYMAELGDEGVLLFLADSTYAEIEGYTPSEKMVGEALDTIMANAEGRVIVATFASLISRVQQVVDAAGRHGRKVFVTGRSMMNNVSMARQLGYLDIPSDIMATVDDLRRLPPERIAIVTTGSQGEPTSALARMANSDHKHVRILQGDTIVISATPIPGNEQYVYRVVDNLFRLGANVLYNRIANVHVRGHAAQEELKIVHSLVRPKYFVPVHGEYRHLKLHAQLAVDVGLAKENAFVLLDGDVLEIDEQGARQGERVSANYVYVDGLGVGDVDHVVLRDRRHLASDGVIVVIMAIEKQSGRLVGSPELISRGVSDPEELDATLRRAVSVVGESLQDGGNHYLEVADVTQRVKDAVAKFVYQETHRRPMVLPVTVEV